MGSFFVAKRFVSTFRERFQKPAKMRNLLLFISLIIYLPVKSQTPYGTLFLNKPQYFRGWTPLSANFIETSPVSVLHFSAMTLSGGESTLIGFQSMYDTAQVISHCINHTEKSWFGSIAKIRSDMVEVYRNDLNDSIFYDPKAGVGQSFTMYEYSNGDYLNVTVDSIVYAVMPAFSDSVKWMSLQRLNSIAQPVADPLNGQNIAVSRDSGWVLFFEANYFPQTWAIKERISYIPGTMRAAVFNFNVGDIFQYRYITQSALGGFSIPPAYSEETVIASQFFNGGDSVEYVFSKKLMSFVFNPIPFPHLDTTTVYSIDTVRYGQLLSPLWTVWPMEPLYIGFPFKQVAYTHIDTGFCEGQGVYSLYTGTFMFDQLQSCYPSPFEPVILKRSYSNGLGEVLYRDDARSIGGNLFEKSLIWHSRSGLDCGTHVTFTGIDQPEQVGFTMYPNPAVDQLTLIIANPEAMRSLQLTGIDGRDIPVRFRREADICQLDVSSLQPGVYFIAMGSGNGRAVQRFIKQ